MCKQLENGLVFAKQIYQKENKVCVTAFILNIWT